MKVYLAKHTWIKHLAVQDLTKLSFVDSKKVVRKLVVEKIGSPFIARARIWGLGRWLSGKCIYMSARTSAPFSRTHANWEVTVSICNPSMSNWDVIVACNPVCPRQMKKCRNPQNIQGQLAVVCNGERQETVLNTEGKDWNSRFISSLHICAMVHVLIHARIWNWHIGTPPHTMVV